MDKFDYDEALKELEKIAMKVEDPETGLDEIGLEIERSRELIAACRTFLRSQRETVVK